VGQGFDDAVSASRRQQTKGRHSAGLFLFLVMLSAVLAGSARTFAAPLRVLFIGNSLTATNDLPGMFTALAAAAGQERPVTRTLAVGGFSLEDHWNQGLAQKVIREGKWDIVVLQQGPSALVESRRLLVEYARRFGEQIQGVKATAAMYAVWPSVTRQGDFGGAHNSYTAAAQAIDAKLLPVGDAWHRILREHRDIALYSDDGLHPTPAGTYLAALVIYRVLYNAPVTGLPALGIKQEDAQRMQRMVDHRVPSRGFPHGIR
jgi:hypothetical protein